MYSNYLLPESERQGDYNFESFRTFWAYSDALEHRNNRLNPKRKRLSMIADLMKERATRQDIPFQEIMQAELLAFLMSLLSNALVWYPHTLIYN